MPKHMLLVFSDPMPGREDEYHAWYNEVHVREVLKLEGFVRGQRFRVTDAVPGVPGVTNHRYLAVYELDTDDPTRSMRALSNAIRSGSIHVPDVIDAANGNLSLLSACSDQVNTET